MPPVGAEWIFVAYKAETGDLGVNLCTPHAAASDPTGQAMYNDAVATFGDGIVVADPAGSAPGEAGAVPVLPIVVGAIAVLVLAIAATVVYSRRDRGEAQPG